ncbi:hypothetical protein HK098_005419 [Nowakowskiella sp. JEL0407]|nr:hypothetical protein HK098_005419 [Nowakowskiella sp. JEL0407]
MSSNKNIVILGASKGVGFFTALHLVKDGNNNNLTLLLRKPELFNNLPEITELSDDCRNRIMIVPGDAFNQEDVEKTFQTAHAVAPIDCVIATIGGTMDFSNPLYPKLVPPLICTNYGSVLLRVLRSYLETNNTKTRLIAVTSNGLGKEEFNHLTFSQKALYSWLLVEPHIDKENFEFLIFQASGTQHPDPSIQKTAAKELVDHDLSLIDQSQHWLKNFVIVRPAFLSDGPEVGKYLVDRSLHKRTGISRADVGHFIGKELIGKNNITWDGGAVAIAY